MVFLLVINSSYCFVVLILQGKHWWSKKLPNFRGTALGTIGHGTIWSWEFMQRGLDSQTKKQLEEEEKKIISEEHWYLDVPDLKEKESYIIEERSFLRCEDLVYGRMSFKGFNPEIEKLMIQMNSKCKEEEIEEDDKMEADVSDEEMARRYETLVGTIGKKFLRKRDQRVLKDDDEDDEVEEGNSNTRPNKRAKKMFLKPQD
uniref:M-phase phosphoprotein 6 n=2 Tax=Ficedula albicollis TaxID=59894 RepID=A0A803VWP0_FICAL